MDQLFNDLPMVPAPHPPHEAAAVPAQEEKQQAWAYIVVAGDPVPKGRPRARMAFGRGKQFIVFYQPKETQEYEQNIREAARRSIGDSPPLEGPVSIMIYIYLPLLKSWSHKKQAAALREEILPAVRPDIDNYVKAALDGMNGIVYKDDGQVTDLFVSKRYAERPRMEIEIYA